MPEQGTEAGEVIEALATQGLGGDWVMRLSVTSGATGARDIEISAEAIVSAWRAERLTQQRAAALPDAA